MVFLGPHFSSIEHNDQLYTSFQISISDGDSFHSASHKLAAYLCIIHRLINTPISRENFNKEVSNIERIALNNIHIDVEKIISGKLRKKKALASASTLKSASPPRMK